jgi:hypothetical protein
MKQALVIIMGHYSPGMTYDHPSSILEHATVVRIDLDSVSVEHSGYQG